MVSRRLVFAATVLLLLACSAEAGWGKKKQAAEVSLPPSGGAPLLDRASEALERAGHGGLVQRKGESAAAEHKPVHPLLPCATADKFRRRAGARTRWRNLLPRPASPRLTETTAYRSHLDRPPRRRVGYCQTSLCLWPAKCSPSTR